MHTHDEKLNLALTSNAAHQNDRIKIMHTSSPFFCRSLILGLCNGAPPAPPPPPKINAILEIIPVPQLPSSAGKFCFLGLEKKKKTT